MNSGLDHRLTWKFHIAFKALCPCHRRQLKVTLQYLISLNVWSHSNLPNRVESNVGEHNDSENNEKMRNRILASRHSSKAKIQEIIVRMWRHVVVFLNAHDERKATTNWSQLIAIPLGDDTVQHQCHWRQSVLTHIHTHVNLHRTTYTVYPSSYK